MPGALLWIGRYNERGKMGHMQNIKLWLIYWTQDNVVMEATTRVLDPSQLAARATARIPTPHHPNPRPYYERFFIHAVIIVRAGWEPLQSPWSYLSINTSNNQRIPGQ